MREARWDDRSQYMGTELRDRTLGVIGFGGIGRALVKLLAGFGMKPPLVFDPFVTPADATRLGVTLVPLDELLSESDFVSIHCPLNEQTREPDRRPRTRADEADRVPHQHGPRRDRGRGGARRSAPRQAASPGPRSTASRTSRSPPRRRSPTLDNVLLAPHCIAWTDELFRDIGRTVCRGMLDLAEGRVPKGVVNREVLDRPGFQAKWKSGSLVISHWSSVACLHRTDERHGLIDRRRTLTRSLSHAPCPASSSCSSPAPRRAADPIVPPDAKLEKVFDGGLVLTEGVAVAPGRHGLLQRHHLHARLARRRRSRSRPGTSGSSTRRPARRRSSARPSGMSNGLKFDADGNLLAAEGADYGGRRVTRTDMKTGKTLHHRRAVRGQAVQLAQRHHHRREGPHLLQRPALPRPRADRPAGAGRLPHRHRRLASTASSPTPASRTAWPCRPTRRRSTW